MDMLLHEAEHETKIIAESAKQLVRHIARCVVFVCLIKGVCAGLSDTWEQFAEPVCARVCVCSNWWSDCLS